MTDTLEDIVAAWDGLSIEQRAEMLREGKAFPGETTEEAKARLKNTLGLLDDTDLIALTGTSEATLARHRVNGTGPRPIKVLRSIYYDRDDVLQWLRQNREGKEVAV